MIRIFAVLTIAFLLAVSLTPREAAAAGPTDCRGPLERIMVSIRESRESAISESVAQRFADCVQDSRLAQSGERVGVAAAAVAYIHLESGECVPMGGDTGIPFAGIPYLFGLVFIPGDNGIYFGGWIGRSGVALNFFAIPPAAIPFTMNATPCEV